MRTDVSVADEDEMTGKIQLHFKGDIARDHKVSVRTLGTALQHMQSAIDRAYLDVKHGQVWKHARLKSEEYLETDFILGNPSEGGYIIDLASKKGAELVERIREAIAGAIAAAEQEAGDEIERLRGQVEAKQQRILRGEDTPRTFEEFERGGPSKKLSRAYGDRSIAKEFDLALSTIRHRNAGDSALEVEFVVNNKKARYEFNRTQAKAFHRAISKRVLGDAVVYSGFLRSLDKGNQFSGMRGKFRNSYAGREVTIHIGSEVDFNQLHPHLRGKQEIEIIASPVIEYGAYDSKGGDIYFIALLETWRQANEKVRRR